MSLRYSFGARRRTPSTPGNRPCASKPRRTQSCITCQMRISRCADLRVRIPGALARQHQFVDLEAPEARELEQPRRGVELVRRQRARIAGSRRHTGLQDEASADAVVLLAREHRRALRPAR